jgi:glucose/mannose transport system permease protein
MTVPSVPPTLSGKRLSKLFKNWMAKIASLPMILTALVVFVGGTAWTVTYSFTGSRMLPRTKWVGLDQYERLWSSDRWMISITNLGIYGICSLILTLFIGFTLAACLDRKIRFEGVFRSIFLYPFALSFVVTGLAWQWILNPDFGMQSVVRDWGWTAFNFDPLNNPDIVMFGLLIAGIWQGSGLIMCIMLAGLRGIDEDIWKAAKVDGIGTVKTYIMVVNSDDAACVCHSVGADRGGHHQAV